MQSLNEYMHTHLRAHLCLYIFTYTNRQTVIRVCREKKHGFLIIIFILFCVARLRLGKNPFRAYLKKEMEVSNRQQTKQRHERAKGGAFILHKSKRNELITLFEWQFWTEQYFFPLLTLLLA